MARLSKAACVPMPRELPDERARERQLPLLPAAQGVCAVVVLAVAVGAEPHLVAHPVSSKKASTQVSESANK